MSATIATADDLPPRFPGPYTAEQVKFEFERGRLFILDDPLLPLLLLSEPTAEWVEEGFRWYLRAQFVMYAPASNWDGAGESSLTEAQWDGPFLTWVRTLIRPGDWDTVAKVDKVVRQGREHYGRRGFTSAYDVARAAGVAPWPALVRLLRRLRETLTWKRKPPVHGLEALERLLGLSVPASP